MADDPPDDEPLLRPPVLPRPDLEVGPEVELIANPKGSLYADRRRQRARRRGRLLALAAALAALTGAGLWLALR